MGYTKREFIIDAFDEIGLASFNFDLQPEQMQSALRKLDRMLATWNGKGIRLGYPLPSTPKSSNLDDSANVPDSAHEAIVLNLAISIAPSFGKTVSPETKGMAKSAYQSLLSDFAKPSEMQISGIPKGAGSKSYNNNEFIQQDENLVAGADSELDFT